MKTATVFVTEKLSILRRMAPVLSERCEAPVYAITTYYLGLSWMGKWPESRPAMERYLKTFFGKQSRFSRVDQ